MISRRMNRFMVWLSMQCGDARLRPASTVLAHWGLFKNVTLTEEIDELDNDWDELFDEVNEIVPINRLRGG